ncbi:MAG: hypothetical protein KY475_16465 [Planctomycetes bacterium]|nr:hypothetical protein [Planctomycetota bacterium]
MTLLLFLVGVFFICMAMLWTEGLWSNAITLVNVMISAMLAMSFWEPLANWLQGQMPSFDYVLDIIAVWGIFAFAMGDLRAVTAYLSKRKVRFHKLMESLGNIGMSMIVAGVITFFTAWTLHLAPLAPDPFRGANLAQSFWPKVWSGPMSFASGGTMSGGRRLPSDLAGRYRQRREALAELPGFRKPS